MGLSPEIASDLVRNLASDLMYKDEKIFLKSVL